MTGEQRAGFVPQLRVAFRAAGFRSGRQFALSIGMEPTYFARITSGAVKRPTDETLKRIAEGLGLQYTDVLSWLVDFDGAGEEERHEGDTVLDDVVAFIEHDPEVQAQLLSLERAVDAETFAAFKELLAEAWKSSILTTVRSVRLGQE